MDSRGVILIITLWILAILILFVFGLGFRMSLEARLTDYNATEVKNLYRAKAALNMLKTAISEDEHAKCDYLSEDWSYNEELFKDIEVGKDGGTFTISYVRAEGPAENIFYGAMDEESKININTIAARADADPDSRDILMNLFSEADNAEEIVDSILDWVDPDPNPRTEGAETSYYETFGDFDYACKNSPLDSIEELLLVNGMTPEIFQTVRDKITVFSEGRVNLARFMGYARAKAISERVDTRLNFDFEIGKYWLTEAADPERPDQYGHIKGRLGRFYSVPRGITLSGEDTWLEFYPNGRSEDFKLFIEGRADKERTIKVKGQTGEPEITETR